MDLGLFLIQIWHSSDFIVLSSNLATLVLALYEEFFGALAVVTLYVFIY